MVILRLRPATVNTTATYYIKTAAVDVRSAMTCLEPTSRQRIGFNVTTMGH
jgi:hypothetical protein